MTSTAPRFQVEALQHSALGDGFGVVDTRDRFRMVVGKFFGGDAQTRAAKCAADRNARAAACVHKLDVSPSGRMATCTLCGFVGRWRDGVWERVPGWIEDVVEDLKSDFAAAGRGKKKGGG